VVVVVIDDVTVWVSVVVRSGSVVVVVTVVGPDVVVMVAPETGVVVEPTNAIVEEISTVATRIQAGAPRRRRR
jgi:hypothetical protein